MIITCPNCNSEYDILKTALGDEGREVKCAKCKETWLALPDGYNEPREEPQQTPQQTPKPEPEPEEEDTTLEADPPEEDVSQEQDLEKVLQDITENINEEGTEEVDIPDAVKPPIEREEVASLSSTKSLAAKMTGYGLALLLFGALIGAAFVNKNKIVTAWPPSALLYEMAGSPVQFKGEGLIVESLSATILPNKDNIDVLIIKGRVVNLTSDSIDVPKIEARLRSTNGRNIETWIIDSPVEAVAVGESFAFTSEYPNVPANVGTVNLAFLPTLN